MFVIQIDDKDFVVYLEPDRGDLMGILTSSPFFQNAFIFKNRNEANKTMKSLTNSNDYKFKDKNLKVKEVILK